MKRSRQWILQCAFGSLALLVSSSAWAQTFGEKGQLAISAERLFGFVHNSSTVTGPDGVETTTKSDSFSLLSSTLTPSPVGSIGGGLAYSQPRVAGDYFVIDHLSVGAALGYSHTSVTLPPTGNVQRSTTVGSWTFAPRAGYSLLFSDMIGFWPRAGFTYRSFSAGSDGGHVFALTIEAPFTFSLIPHVVFTAGPTLDLGLTGSVDNTQGNTTISNDFSSTEIGLQTALIATVW
jgi:hypothetical protein